MALECELIQLCCSFTSAFKAHSLCCFLFVLVPERVFWVRCRSCLQSADQWPALFTWEIWRVCVCLYTITLLCFRPQIKCQQKQLLKFEVARLQPISQSDICFRIQCCVSCVVNGFLTKCQECGSQGIGQLDDLFWKELHFFCADNLCSVCLFFSLCVQRKRALWLWGALE